MKYTNGVIKRSKTVDELVKNVIDFKWNITELHACQYISVHCLDVLETILNRKSNEASKYDLMIINAITTKEDPYPTKQNQTILELYNKRK